MAFHYSVCVYCGSSNQAPEIYKKAARELGVLLAQRKIRVVYGGSKMGLMGVLSKAALESSGHVAGYMTQFLYGYEGGNEDITELHIVDSMHERKQRMFQASDAFMILPGGLGTLDEIFEVMTWKQLGLHQKPIIIVDSGGYWSPLFETFFQRMIDHHFVRPQDRALFTMVTEVKEAVKKLEDLQKVTAHPAHEQRVTPTQKL